MTLRESSPSHDAADAARERWGEIFPVPPGGDEREAWRQVAMAAIAACDLAQACPTHVPLMTETQIVLRIPVVGWRSRAVSRWLAVAQRRDRRRARAAPGHW